MPINETKETKDLLIEYDYGVFNGKAVTKQRTYKVSTTATSEQVHALGMTISGLCEKDLLKVKAREVSTLTEG